MGAGDGWLLIFAVDNRSNEPGLTQSLSRSLAWNIVYFVSSKRQMTLDNCFTWPAYQGRVLHLVEACICYIFVRDLTCHGW